MVLLLFSLNTFTQIKEQTYLTKLSGVTEQSNKKYFDVNNRFIFEYGILFCVNREETAASTGSVTYDFNLIAKRLYGSLQLGGIIVHSEEKAGGGLMFGFGFDCSVYTEDKYNFSVYLGAQGIMAGWPAAFGVIHLRNSIITDDIGAFTFGLRYLPQLGTKDHWLMPTFGYQLWLR